MEQSSAPVMWQGWSQAQPTLLKGEKTMEIITRTDLKHLSRLCKACYYESRAAMVSSDTTDLEKALANHQADYMVRLMDKLDRIADSNAKRVEITF